MSRIANQRWFSPILIVSWCSFLFIYGINAGDLYRTESLRAIIAREMLESGNWIVPTLYGQPLLTKPPGAYIAIALASLPFGEVTTWSARLPSVLAATFLVWLFFWYFGRHLGAAGGLIAALILPASALFLDKVPSAEIDILQVAWVSGGIIFFLRGLEEGSDQSIEAASQKRRCLWWVAALGCVAGGFLTKWTAPLFFYATLVPLLYLRGQLRLLLSSPHLFAAGVGVLLGTTWVIDAGITVGWETLWTAVSREALQHLSPIHHRETVELLGESHHHRLNYGINVLLFPLQIFAMTLPWSLFALLTVRRSFRDHLEGPARPLVQALHCWLWPNLLIWTVLPDPSPRHAAPLVPAIAGLAAIWWILLSPPRGRGVGGEGAVGQRSWQQYLLAMLVVWLMVKVVFVELIIPTRMALRQPREKGELIASLLPQGVPLYLFQVKDEGIMFYCRRLVLRLAGPEDLPSSPGPIYCIVKESEWQTWPASRPARTLLELQDQQGDPILLVMAMSDSSVNRR